MILRHLTAHNFKHLDLDMVLPEGILAISGPNESGKSSILEAILFALFGRTPKAPRGEKDRLINYQADSALVQLVFEAGGKRYRVSRHIHRDKPTQASLYQLERGGREHKLATGVTAVNKELRELLGGVGMDDLLASNVVLQKDLDRLSEMEKMDRRHVINAMMGRECFTKAVDRLIQERRDLKNRLGPEKESLRQLEERKKDYEQASGELEEKKRRLVELEEQLKETSRKFAIAEKHFKAVKAHRDAIEVRNRIQMELRHREELARQTDESLSKMAEFKRKRRALLSRQRRFARLNKDLASMKLVRSTADQLKSTLSNFEASKRAVERLIRQLAKLEEYRGDAEAYQRILEQIRAAGGKGVIHPLIYIPSIGLMAAGLTALLLNPLIGFILIACSLPFLAYLVKGYFSYLTAEEHLDDLRLQEQRLRERASLYQSKPQLEKQLEEERRSQSQLEQEISRLGEELRSRLAQLSPELLERYPVEEDAEPEALLEAARRVEEYLNKLEAERSSLQEQLQFIEGQLKGEEEQRRRKERLAQEIKEFEEKLSSLKIPPLPEAFPAYSEELYRKVDEERRQLGEEKAQLQATRKETMRRIKELTTFLKETEGVEEEYEQKRKEVEQLEEQLAVTEMTIKLLREVAEHGREKVRPRVEDAMGPLLAAITDGKYRFPKLSEDYSLKVFSAEAGEYIQADLFSGGTEDQFLLALRLAFAIALLPHGRPTAPQFLLLDEPFAGSDTKRRGNIIRLLREELTKAFRQMIVVSHQREILAASEHRLHMVEGRIIRTTAE